MLRPKRLIDPAAAAAKLDDLAEAVRREAEQDQLDPYDDAVVNAVLGLAELAKTELVALNRVEAQAERLRRKV